MRAAVLAALLVLAVAPPAAHAGNARADERSAGSDLTTARTIATALLAQPRAAQLLRVRCERVGPHADCGLVVSGVKFHRALDLAGWNAEIADLIDGAFRAAPDLAEVDCWATVPLDAGKGSVVSGDYAKPTSANVFSITAPRAARGAVRARLADGRGVFWDPAFRAALSKGTRG
ncbi:MAG: hypothetical protein JO225_04165 [Candidatus Eremiobacteraeota bacterium]|nr:hypothetical protein [Candidatus Eremiobacteraeota bacterium]